jgi:hypothetical protein
MFDEMFQFASVNRVGDFNLNFRASTIFFPDQWQRGMRIKRPADESAGLCHFIYEELCSPSINKANQ